MPNTMVLAAGLGTRLRPLTNELPKPLLPFGDRWLLEHAFAFLRSAALGPRVIVNTHHLPEAFAARREDFSLDVVLCHEPTLLGTAGGIRNARPLLEDGPLLCLTSDIVLDALPPDLLSKTNTGNLVLAVARRALGSGSVGVGEDGRVVRLRGQSFGVEVAGGDYVGLMALGERALGELPQKGCYIGDYAVPLLARGGRVEAVEYSGRAIVLGDDVERYVAENLRWLARSAAPHGWVGPGASVAAGVTVAGSLVGAGARVEGQGRLQSSLVFPGALARAPLENSVVLPSGRLVPYVPRSYVSH